MRKFAAPMALSLTLVLAASCVSLERKPVDKHFYALETARPEAAVLPSGQAAQAQGKASVLVRRLQVAPRAAGRELVYRTAPSAWTADYYNVFFVSPADMLTQDLRAWLASSQVFANVLDPGSLAASEYILEGNVSSLHGDFASKPSQAVAGMQFLLLRTGGDERQVVLAREYRKSVPLAADTPQELVRALRQAVAGIYGELEADLSAALARK